MSATHIPLYREMHADVQGWLDQGHFIGRALELAAESHGVSVSTTRRAYYHVKNFRPEYSDDNLAVLQQAIQENRVEMGVVVDITLAKKRRRKRGVRL